MKWATSTGSDLVFFYYSWVAFNYTATGIPTETREENPVTATDTVFPPTLSPVLSKSTLIFNDSGLIWKECELPPGDYYRSKRTMELANQCFNANIPQVNEEDKKIFGSRLDNTNDVSANLQLTIGEDIYETIYKRSNTPGFVFDYELLKNGMVFAKASSYYSTYDPNRALLNIGGKPVWELADPYHPVIIFDGINLNESNHWKKTFVPYAINGKLIYIGERYGKYQVVYDGMNIGPEFDQISISYCCATLTVLYGQGQYWFWGRRENKQFIIALSPQQ